MDGIVWQNEMAVAATMFSMLQSMVGGKTFCFRMLLVARRVEK